MRHIDTQKVKTRKNHTCVGCNREFTSGTEMEINKYVMEDEIRSDYWCKTCSEYASKYMKGEFEFMLGEFKDKEGWGKVKK